jgi:hypothetical protein
VKEPGLGKDQLLGATPKPISYSGTELVSERRSDVVKQVRRDGEAEEMGTQRPSTVGPRSGKMKECEEKSIEQEWQFVQGIRVNEDPASSEAQDARAKVLHAKPT